MKQSGWLAETVDDAAARATASRVLREHLEDLRAQPGCPDGSADAIMEMSSAPAYTACPNPFIGEWLPSEPEALGEDDRPDPGPFASDSTAGKTSLVYKAHGYPTKVPPEAIMRLLLHYTRPGDVVLDGFCGTGTTGVAAQMCGLMAPSDKATIEAEMGPVAWGARRAVLQDLSPSATFIAAGLNLSVDADKFDQASRAMLDRFDREWGWMYQTTVTVGQRTFSAQIDYTVWSEIRTCPHCGASVEMYAAAFHPDTGRVDDEFRCPTCGAAVTKEKLKPRFTKVRTLAGDVIDRIEFQPVAIHWHTGKERGVKTPDAVDLDVLRKVGSMQLPPYPTMPLPYMHMTHERSTTYKSGFRTVDTLWPDRALAALSVLWQWTDEAPDSSTRRALRFWVEQAFWGLSWMNIFKAQAYSQVNRAQSGVYYIPSLVSECSVRYNLEGSLPNRGKRANLVKMWRGFAGEDRLVRISTASSTHLAMPDDSADYVFVDPPFGANINYTDLAYVLEAWHGVVSAADEEAIVDHNKQRHKGLPEYTALMTACFREFHRVLKPGRWMTVEFSNSATEVWAAIQHGLAQAGFVVADTRIFDKQQHSYRQVTAANAVKQDLIISAYKPRAATVETTVLAQGSEEGVRAFLADHLAHLPVKDGRRREPRVVRERMPDRLYDRMVAFHVARGIDVPMTVPQFNDSVDRWFIQRDGAYFLPHQAEEWERFRMTFKDLQRQEFFIVGESTAVQWLRQFLKKKPRAYAEVQPAFFAEVQAGTAGWEDIPDLSVLLQQNFIQEDGRWMVPDPKRADHLAQLRERELLRVFKGYLTGKARLRSFRSEAMRAGFKDAWAKRDFATIVAVGRRLPADAMVDDPALLHYFRNAERLGE